MNDVKYELRYMPLFYDDLKEKVDYIAEKLINPIAANELLDAVEKAILERLPMAEAFEPYHSMRQREKPYYRIYVKNYIIYYVVLTNEYGNKIMEVRRFLYNKQDRNRKV